ncbi:hypothetical protein HZH68_012223 [Vespula germanica]|uniref:Uncharacterized protein n=1 Tax=Vespula germanica TaxID=30212 RepID=A0A834JH05_VESGE|nr:hypothetical protein HZH68_012223 [Vespula germanica]
MAPRISLRNYQFLLALRGEKIHSLMDQLSLGLMSFKWVLRVRYWKTMDLSIIVDEDRVIEETKTIALERNSNAFPKMRNTDSTVFSRPVREWYVRADQYILVRFIELTLTRVAGSITIQITAEVFVESSINGSQLDRAFSPTTFRIILVRDASLELSALQRAEDTGVIIYNMGTIAPHREVEKIFATVTLINSKKADDQHRRIIRAKA